MTADGLETQLAVNHLAAFLLTHELRGVLEASAPARVVTVSSAAHRGVTLNLSDLQSESRYRSRRVYGRTKLANVLFSAELNRRLGSHSAVRAYAADPGLVNTSIGLKGTSGIERWVWQRRMRGGVSPEEMVLPAVLLTPR